MKKFAPILAILGLTALECIAETPLQCTSSGAGEKFIVEVKLTSPHPAEDRAPATFHHISSLPRHFPAL
jgi:hypothetical protein